MCTNQMIWSFRERRLNLADYLSEFKSSVQPWNRIELVLPGPTAYSFAKEIDRKAIVWVEIKTFTILLADFAEWQLGVTELVLGCQAV